MKKAPVIGVISAEHHYNTLMPTFTTMGHYVEQTAAAGAVPMQIPMIGGMEQEKLQSVIDRCDGFLLPGGDDFVPEWYGETLLPGLTPDPACLSIQVQDTALRFIRLAIASGKPILGICLGLQVLNIAMGGTLYQDIPTQFPSTLRHRNPAQVPADRWRIAHTVTTAEDSLLRSITGKARLGVNSFHHQAVKDIAPCFRAAAWAEDGLVEALECRDKPILGVQWHPENMSHAEIPEAQALFRWLAEAASRK